MGDEIAVGGVEERALEDRRRALTGIRLTPALVERPLGQAQDRLDALARLASQLHPKKPLERGYAIVRGADGVVTSREGAARETALTLEFRDGEIAVGVGDAPPPAPPPPPKPARARKSPPKDANPRQDDLFG